MEIGLFGAIQEKPLRSLPDVTARKHKGNPASIAANPSRSTKQDDAQKILAFIRFKRTSYLKEIVRELGIPVQTASGRLADLKAAGKIYDTGARAEKCGVVKAV